MSKKTMNAIVAVARNGTIGRGNELPWKLSSDLQRFKRITMGHALIMGRKTFESIGKPLPGRQSIVLSRNKEIKIQGVAVVSSLEEAIDQIPPQSVGFVVGGAEIYRLALPIVTSLYLTRVLADVEGDAYFCNWAESEFECIEHSFTPADSVNDWPTEFFHLKRKTQ